MQNATYTTLRPQILAEGMVFLKVRLFYNQVVLVDQYDRQVCYGKMLSGGGLLMFLFLLVLGASSTVCVSDEIACDFLKPTCVCLCVVLVRLFEALFLCFEERRLPRSSKKEGFRAKHIRDDASKTFLLQLLFSVKQQSGLSHLVLCVPPIS